MQATEFLDGGLPTDLTCSSEDPIGAIVTGTTGLFKRKQNRKRGQIDWVFHPRNQTQPSERDFQLAVEVKIEHHLAVDQLRRYHESLMARKGHRGLLVLARTLPEAHLLDESHQLWLGVALWKPVLDRLKRVQPENGDLTLQWKLFLDVISAWDDLGGPTDWNAIFGNDWQLVLKRLRDGIKSEADEALQKALAERAPPGTNLDYLLRTKSTGSKELTSSRSSWVGLNLMVPSRSRTPTVTLTIKRHLRKKGLWIETGVMLSDDRWLSKRRRRDRSEAIQTLCEARPGKRPYTEKGRLILEQRQLLDRDSNVNDVEQALGAFIQAELVHIAESGVLDEYVVEA
jgi:hypothetical protein